MTILETLRNNLSRLRAERAEAVQSMTRLAAEVEARGAGHMDLDETARFEKAGAIIAAADPQITAVVERIAELEDLAARQENANRRAPATDGGSHVGHRGTTPARAAALSMVERTRFAAHDAIQAITVAVERGTDDVAHAIEILSDPAYVSGFLRVMANPVRGHQFWSDDERRAFVRAETELRAMSEGSTGSYAVPTPLDPIWNLSGAGSVSPLRRIAKLKTTTSATYKAPVAAQISASWDGESTAVSDDSPVLSQQSITLSHGRAFAAASYEMIDDVADLAAAVVELFADAKNNLENDSFVNGTGSSQPQGAVYAVDATTASRVSSAGANAFAVADLYAVQNALPVRHSANAVWMMNLSTINRARQFATANNYHAFLADATADTPGMLLGRRLEECSAITSTITAGQSPIIFGDFARYFTIADHVAGTRVEPIANLFDTSTGRPTGQRGWLLHWRSGSAWATTDAARVLRIV